MSVRIGTNPIAWSNDDLPELGGDTPLDTCLAEAQAAGFAGIELGHKFPRTEPALRPLLRQHRLDLVSGWYGAELRRRDPEAEIAALEDHLALLSAMGCTVMVFAEVSDAVHGDRAVPVDARPRLSEAEWTDFAARLDAVAGHLAGRGVRLAYHHHMGTVVETEEEIDRLMELTGEAVGLLFDTGHLAYAGGDPVGVAERHARRIVHVHCKDVRPDVLARARSERLSFLDAVIAGVFTVPGDGAIDFVAALAPLAEAGYHGWLVVEAEQDPAKAEPARYARMGYEALTAACRRAGLSVG